MDPSLDFGVLESARGIHDVPVPRHDILNVARKDAARAEKVDLEDESVERVVLVEDVLQRSVGDDPSVPEMISGHLEKLLSMRIACGSGVNVHESERERSGIICRQFCG